MDEDLSLSLRAFLLVLREHFDGLHRAERRAIEDVDGLLAAHTAGEIDADQVVLRIRTIIHVLQD